MKLCEQAPNEQDSGHKLVQEIARLLEEKENLLWKHRFECLIRPLTIPS